MNRTSLLLAGTLALGFATSAPAQHLTLRDGYKVVPAMTYTTAAAVDAARTNGSYTGVGSLFVTTRSTATTGFGYACSGSLLSSNVVVTAGHCLSDYDDTTYDPVTSVTFYLPSRNTPGRASYAASSWLVSPTFNAASLTSGGDYALFTLANNAFGYDTYGIYDGYPLDQYTRVGSGSVGGPAGTGTGGVAQDGLQRAGNNLFEFPGNLVTGWSPFILLSDFDDGTPEHDVFGQLLGEAGAQLGIPGEADSSPGDSGGPEFIDGRIVSVTSFGISGDAFRVDGNCGQPDSIDPFGVGGTTGDAAGPAGCTNSSVGELAGDTWLLPYRSFISAYVAAAAPEPATWAMMIAGFGMVGLALRRRRPSTGLAAA